MKRICNIYLVIYNAIQAAGWALALWPACYRLTQKAGQVYPAVRDAVCEECCSAHVRCLP